MKIWKYENYDEYVAAQTKYNKQKLDWVYVKERSIDSIVKDKGEAKSVLCHGTRNGAEQRFFKSKYPDAFVLGTEISETASKFEMTVQHDFTKVNEEWIGKFDIVYSNSFDHSIEPETTIRTWKNQLTETGKLYIEYSEAQAVCEEADPLYATNKEVVQMMEDAGFSVAVLPGKRSGHKIFVGTIRKV